MPKKDTEELEEALSGARDVRDYFDENADELAERTLAEELARLLAEKHLTKTTSMAMNVWNVWRPSCFLSF